jgi:DNA-nicking Smr family endonuclease
MTDEDAPIEIEINGVLDLHGFAPSDLRTLIPDYLEECSRRGIYAVRLVHGKGIGAIRRSVHGLLDRSLLVAEYALAGGDRGGWGATVVTLRPRVADDE